MKLTQEQTNRIFNTITSNGCREMEEDRFNQAVELEHKSIIEKICFSKAPCKLKEKYYKAFNELPKAENTIMLGGVQIVEEDILPPNTMVWRFSNSTDNRIFIYKDSNLYELPKFKPLSL